MAARASTRRSARLNGLNQSENGAWATKSSEDDVPDNNELRQKIERERGSSKQTGINKKVDEGDFQAVLKKEGVGTNPDSMSQRSFVEKPAFDIVIASAIVVNCFVLGLEIDLAQQTPPSLWILLENIFCITWIAEAVLKLYCLKLAYFKDPWNYLDMFLVFLAIYDAWISPFMASTSDLGYLRVIRMLRLLRLVKLFKVMKMSRNLWLLVQGFIESFSTLCWVSFLILFVIYAYSCLFRIVVDCSKDYSSWNDCSMLFGTMPKAMFTLFQMLTLESWSMLIARPLIEVNPILLVAIISFLLLTTFGLLNIIVGVVVENTLSVAKQNMDLQTKRAERQLFKELELLRTVFEEADVDGSGTMDKREFCEICNTISVRRALQRMGVPLDQSETLFDIIDTNKMGEVSFPDFVEGVKNVRGVPTNLDMKTMIVAVRNIHKQQVRFEKESVQLQRVLLNFIKEAQEEGNVIHLPPKDELDELLKVRKKLVSMPTGSFSNYSGNGSVAQTGLREEARHEVFAEHAAQQIQSVEVPSTHPPSGVSHAHASEASHSLFGSQGSHLPNGRFPMGTGPVDKPPPSANTLPGQPIEESSMLMETSRPPSASNSNTASLGAGESPSRSLQRERKLHSLAHNVLSPDSMEPSISTTARELDNQPQLDCIPGERRPMVLKPSDPRPKSRGRVEQETSEREE